jgi:hypothetical protein
MKVMEDIIYQALMNGFYKRLAYLKGLEIITLSAYVKKTKLSLASLIKQSQTTNNPRF